MIIGVVFPGQGCQYDKMGLDFIDSSEESMKFCKSVEEYTSVKVIDLLTDVAKIDEFSQLRIIVAEILTYYAFQSKINGSEIKIKYTGGHSLGEYSALYVSGILSLSELLNLVMFRNKVIQFNQFPEKTSMIAVTDSDISNINKSISQLNIKNLFPSNINSYKQIVYSGSISAINHLQEKLAESTRCIVLNVNKGYHSPLMKDASEKFRDFIQRSDFTNIAMKIEDMKVLNNLTGEYYKSKDEVLFNLPKQLISPVNWIKVIETLSLDVDGIFEVGPGKTLTKFNKNILKKNKVDNIYLGHVENTDTLNLEIGKILYEDSKFE